MPTNVSRSGPAAASFYASQLMAPAPGSRGSGAAICAGRGRGRGSGGSGGGSDNGSDGSSAGAGPKKSHKRKQMSEPPPHLFEPAAGHVPEGSEHWTVGTRLEALDVRGLWCPATALASRGDGPGRELKVHYEGWNKRWDEWVKVSGGRMRRRSDAV